MRMYMTALLLTVPFAGVAAAQDSTSRNQNQYPYQNQSSDSMQRRSKMGPQDDTALLSRLHQINLMEIRMGQLAQRNGSSAKVKQFGQQLVRDHQASDQRVTALAKKMGITLATRMGMDSAGRKNGWDGDRRNGQDTTGRRSQDTTSRQGQFPQNGDSTYRTRGNMDTSSSAMRDHGDDMRDHERMGQKLQSLRGAQFDTAFAQMMVQGHEQAIAMLERAQGTQSSSMQQGYNQQPQQSSQSQTMPQTQQDTTNRSQSQYPQSQSTQTDGQQSQSQDQQSQWQTQQPDVRAFIVSTLPTLRTHLRIAQSLTNSNTNTSSR